MKKFNVGVIGLGVGERHLQYYLKSSFINKIKVYDFDTKKVNKLKSKYFNIEFVKNENEIIKSSEINIVSIASYDNYHAKQILKCLAYKKHIFVEKPICLYESELNKIYKAFKKKKLKLSSNLVLRTAPLFIDLKKQISNGDFGKLFYLEADYLWGRINKFFSWRSKMSYYSKIYGAAVHMIDLVVWLLDKYPSEVFATGNKIATKNTKLKFNSFVNLNLIFHDGLIVKITGNGPCVHPHFHSLKIFGSKKTFIHDYKNSLFIKDREKLKIKNLNLNKKIYPAKQERSRIINSFLLSILKKNNKHLVKSKEVFDVMSICFAAEKSMNSGKKIKIKYL